MNDLDRPESLQYDFGNFPNLNNVTDKVKYNLLKNPFKPKPNYIFPVKVLHGSDRSLNFQWFIEFQFLLYDKINDFVCCLLCILFCKDNNSKVTKLSGFSKEDKVGDKLKDTMKAYSCYCHTLF